MRAQTGVAAGDELVVEIERDDAPREVVIPDDLVALLDRDSSAKQAFEALSYSNKKRHVLAIDGAKTSETRQRRLAKTIEQLREQPPRRPTL